MVVDGKNKSGRPLAKRIKILPEGSIDMFDYFEGSFSGTILEEPRGRKRPGVLAVGPKGRETAYDVHEKGEDEMIKQMSRLNFGVEDIDEETQLSIEGLRVNDEVEFYAGFDWVCVSIAISPLACRSHRGIHSCTSLTCIICR